MAARPYGPTLIRQYASMWDRGATVPSRQAEVNRAVDVLLDAAHLAAYQATERVTGVPVVWHAAVAWREMNGRLDRYLGNGDVLTVPTRDVPRGRGPFASYQAGAADALHYDKVDIVPRPWTLERALYEDELWNGFGYRAHGVLSPYLVGATAIQQAGKYVADGKWDASTKDGQLGTIPIMREIVRRRPDLALPREAADGSAAPAGASPAPVPVGLGYTDPSDTKLLQGALNVLVGAGWFGADEPNAVPLAVDGSFGRRTKALVLLFQRKKGIEQTGLTDDATLAALAEEVEKLGPSVPDSAKPPAPPAPSTDHPQSSYLSTFFRHIFFQGD
jgi:lysozyme family protein